MGNICIKLHFWNSFKTQGVILWIAAMYNAHWKVTPPTWFIFVYSLEAIFFKERIKIFFIFESFLIILILLCFSLSS